MQADLKVSFKGDSTGALYKDNLIITGSTAQPVKTVVYKITPNDFINVFTAWFWGLQLNNQRLQTLIDEGIYQTALKEV